ncbi:nuclease-related domain-containing protein [Pseudoalteromonas sp. YIC-656]|uniref:nuclease-related domain-containing protein n=1 Tax=Pseudoalteromonas pernae TaxID=3118054 RepID=UPI003242C9C8
MKWILFVALSLFSNFLLANEQYTESECILLQHQANDFSHNKLSTQYRSAKQKLDKHCIKPRVVERNNRAAYLTNTPKQKANGGEVRQPVAAIDRPANSNHTLQTSSSTQSVNAFELMLKGLIPIGLWFLLAIVLIAAIRVTVTVKAGAIGEWQVNRLLEVMTKRIGFTLYKNMLFRAENGEWTEVDHLLVTPYGIFVIESKNYQGWIFGSEHQTKWTQSTVRSKTPFMNPLRQNFKHCKAVQAFLELQSGIESLVVFNDKATFKTPMPANVVMLSEMSRYILNFQIERFSAEQLAQINVLLSLRQEQTTKEDYREHLRQVTERMANLG